MKKRFCYYYYTFSMRDLCGDCHSPRSPPRQQHPLILILLLLLWGGGQSQTSSGSGAASPAGEAARAAAQQQLRSISGSSSSKSPPARAAATAATITGAHVPVTSAFTDVTGHRAGPLSRKGTGTCASDGWPPTRLQPSLRVGSTTQQRPRTILLLNNRTLPTRTTGDPHGGICPVVALKSGEQHKQRMVAYGCIW